MQGRKLLAVLMVVVSAKAVFAQTAYPPISQMSTYERLKWAEKDVTKYLKYQDIRFKKVDSSLILSEDDIKRLTFNRLTKWSTQYSEIAESIINKYNYPGLGIRSLHSQGINGSGVSVAIIDQNLAGEHPEFKGKIVKYTDLGCEQEASSGSMHGPAVTSILVGNKTGSAPGASVYYFAVPSWKKDAKYYADALNMIIELNKGLNEGEKIKVVSVSAAPSGRGSPFETNKKEWDEAVLKAKKNNILILDCTSTYGFITPGYWSLEDPDRIDLFKSGWPDSKEIITGSTKICAPTSYRTVAEEYVEGEYSYQYTCKGGLSWAIPYVAGVCALAWQVNPLISAEEMKSILIKSAYITKGKARVVYPKAAIEMARKK